MGVDTECGTQVTREEEATFAAPCSRSQDIDVDLTTSPFKKKKRSTEEVALAVKETTENLSNWNIRES